MLLAAGVMDEMKLHSISSMTPGHEDPEGQLRYNSRISLTLALDSGRQSMPRTGHFTPGKETQYHCTGD